MVLTIQPYPRDEASVEWKVANNPDYRPSLETATQSGVAQWSLDLMARCWAHEPEQRPSCEEIVDELKGHITQAQEEEEEKKKIEDQTPAHFHSMGTPNRPVDDAVVAQQQPSSASSYSYPQVHSPPVPVDQSAHLYTPNPTAVEEEEEEEEQ